MIHTFSSPLRYIFCRTSVMRPLNFPQLGAHHEERALQSRRVQVPSASAATGLSNEDGQLIHNILDFWFGSSNFSLYSDMSSQYALWFGSSKETDDQIRTRFGSHVQRALNNQYDHFIGNNEFPIKSELALTIMLDQFTRNIYRGTAQAFAGDTKARQIVQGLLVPNRWEEVRENIPPTIRVSFTLPLMHQESMEDQALCVRCTEEMIEEMEAYGEKGEPCIKFLRNSLEFAIDHQKLIEKFGRFPHRNATLGRESTEEELEYLKDGSRYGQ